MKPWEFLEEYYEKKKKEAQLPQQEICINCDEQKETHKICMDCIGKIIKENQKEISDEEINKEAKNHHNYYEWSASAKWYREQLKCKGNERA
jgi:ribosomal protein L32